jgi:hypothetical protein
MPDKPEPQLEVDNPGCFQDCGRKNRSGGIWYVGLDYLGEAHFSCYQDSSLLFNVFRVRVQKRQRAKAEGSTTT